MYVYMLNKELLNIQCFMNRYFCALIMALMVYLFIYFCSEKKVYLFFKVHYLNGACPEIIS